MNANELMIGDYLMWNGKPYRVIQVNSVDGESGCTYMLENGEEDCGEPIPLQKIHLTKNGFKATSGYDNRFELKNGYSVVVDYTPAMKIDGIFLPHTYFLSINFAECDMCKEIKYVHELQNYMRMFGVEEKIEL